jgi:thioredoxin reductase (NADPH)
MQPVFKYLHEEEHRQIIALAEFHTYRPNERLFSAGDEQTDIFMLIKGEVRVESGVGATTEVERWGAGEVIGQTSFLEGRPAILNHTAATEVSAFVLSNDKVRKLIGEDSGLGGRFYHSLAAMLSRRLRETSDLVTATKAT